MLKRVEVRLIRPPPQEYRVILPLLPNGAAVLNTVFLHADVTTRLYRVEYFCLAIQVTGVFQGVASTGAYQYSHVWILTLKSLVANWVVNGKHYLILDPNKAEFRIRLHWVPFHVSNMILKDALQKCGKFEEVTQ